MSRAGVSSSWFDRLGSVASATFAVHCMTLSLAPALVSVLGLGILANELFEWGFFVAAVGFAIVAAVLGYRTHRTAWVIGGFAFGILVLAVGRFGEAFGLIEGGVGLAVLGGGVLVASHLASLRRTHACRVEHSA